jgi:hypothetical protein
MNRRRIVVVAVVLAFAWLAVWTYSSGSDATATGVSATADGGASPSPTTHVPKQHPQKQGQGQGKKQKGVPTTLGGPTTTVVANPESYATALFRYWENRDRISAGAVAAATVVTQLFHRRPFKAEVFTAKGCVAGPASTLCTWTSARRRFVMHVRNATGTLPVLVMAVQFLRP